jgi:hypothetical protein
MLYFDAWVENKIPRGRYYPVYTSQTPGFDTNSGQNRVFELIVNFIPTFSVFFSLAFLRKIYT